MVLIPLGVLLLSSGIYFMIKQDRFKIFSIKIDQYSEALDWCKYENGNNTLSIKCRALLLEISNNDNDNSCFKMLIIKDEKGLNSLTICAPNDSISYTNEILGYKKLMPVDVNLTYSRNSILNGYTFSAMSLQPMDESYIHIIVNKDLAELTSSDITEKQKLFKENPDESLSLDIDQYIVSNSVDYCPSPNTLNDFVSKDNRINYETFYTNHIVSENDYLKKFTNNNTNSTITQLFGCDSSRMLGYDLCSIENTKKLSLNDSISDLYVAKIYWSSDKIQDMDKYFIRRISMLYDNIYLNNSEYVVSKADINSVISQINSLGEVNESTFCSLYFLLNSIGEENASSQEIVNNIKDEVERNLPEVSSMICQRIIYDDNLDKLGAYLQMYIKNIGNTNTLNIYNKCDNLNHLFN